MEFQDIKNILFGTNENYDKVHKEYIKKVKELLASEKDEAPQRMAKICMICDRLLFLFKRRNALYYLTQGCYDDSYNAELFGDKPTKRKKATK